MKNFILCYNSYYNGSGLLKLTLLIWCCCLLISGGLAGFEKRNAQEYLESIRHDFDMNFNFQLRKLGIRQGNTSKN